MLALVMTPIRRLTICAVLALLTVDLVDGPTPSTAATQSSASGIVQAAPAGEAHDAEFFCARATVVVPVLVIASEVPLPPLAAAPKDRPVAGFAAPPFHPPKSSF